MAEYPNREPNRHGGADLPKPKRKPAGPSSGGSSRPQNTASRRSGTSGSRKTSGGNPQPRRNAGYGGDTMQLRTDAYDTAFEQRRASQPSGTSRPKPSQPKRSQPKPSHSPKTQPKNSRTKQPQAKKRSSGTAAKNQRRRKPSLLGRLCRGLVVTAAVVFLVYSAAVLFMISRLEKVSDENRTVTSGTLEAPHVTSILLIGTDARNVTTERGRSDSMILVSINSKTKTIYLTSFMRDAYVEIPGHGHNKLNAAYSFGGAELLMDTLELNYQVSIDDYMSISFTGFAGIIDAFGGVELTLSDAEARAVNEILISEVNELMGDAREADLLSGGGTMVLDGKQALSYARIRYVGNADFERTSRQREVMTQLFAKLKTKAVSAVPKLASSALPHVGTNMSTGEMYLLSLRVPLAAGYEIEQIQIPADGTWSGQTKDGQSVLVVDFAKNTEVLRETVYASENKEAQ